MRSFQVSSVRPRAFFAAFFVRFRWFFYVISANSLVISLTFSTNFDDFSTQFHPNLFTSLSAFLRHTFPILSLNFPTSFRLKFFTQSFGQQKISEVYSCIFSKFFVHFACPQNFGQQKISEVSTCIFSKIFVYFLFTFRKVICKLEIWWYKLKVKK